MPRGHDGVHATEITLAVRSIDETSMALVMALDAQRLGGRLQVGETLIALSRQTTRTPTTESRAAGFTNLTAQIFDVVEQHHRFLRSAFVEGTPPMRPGCRSTARREPHAVCRQHRGAG